MNADARIYVAGGNTPIGAALHRRLGELEYRRVVSVDDEPDFHNRDAVARLFDRTRPAYVFVAGGRTAGIGGNQRFPADLMLDNLLVATSVIPAAWHSGVTKLLYLASSCVYPKQAPQPFRTESLWTGPVESTSAAYATAKLAGIALCHAYRREQGAPFITAIAADAYGPGDDFSPEDSHVVGALIRRMHEAREQGLASVEVWGSGGPQREFVYVDDLADACVFAMRHYDGAEPLNLGTGVVTSIAELAAGIREVVGYRGELRFDRTKPDGMPFKGLDSTRLRVMGWKGRWSLRDGLQSTYEWFLKQR
ncbi:MAG: GDP-L-fucose synthase [Acidobacteria bacterium]|nr:GDP-L-fucose synthase [Acidobacteriota bacterium]